jgi:hypothetical protein
MARKSAGYKGKKRKTSIALSPKLLALLKQEARRRDRSVSYILEKYIERKTRQKTVHK